ncbi:hypothetical protein [Mameliella alba]|uniref:Transposase n=1 Tax=Mameliella alba TaxID=561184 RepID=A0A0B3RZP8_9RHOB|nr:Transposase [Mameliella alba]
MCLADAQEKLEGGRKEYNEDRPRNVIGNNVPIAMDKPEVVTSLSPCTAKFFPRQVVRRWAQVNTHRTLHAAG